MPQRVALLFAYDGAAFDSYARQDDARLRTVEGALIARLETAGVFTNARLGRFRTGSRTDAGVSALGNVVAMDADVPPLRVASAVGLGEEGLWPLASLPVDDSFDPRRAASREYRYFLGADELPPGHAAADLQAALEPFLGRHDFSAFARLEAGRDPMRTVEEASVTAVGELVEVRVVGPSFLWNQVRRMVGAGLAVLHGEATTDDIVRMLERPSVVRDLGLAPADRLVLWGIDYTGLRFRPQQSQAERVLASLVQKRVAWALRGRMATALVERIRRDVDTGSD